MKRVGDDEAFNVIDRVIEWSKIYSDDWKSIIEKLNIKDIYDCHKIETIGVFYYKLCNGGTERVVANLVRLWADMGYRIIVFTEEKSTLNDYAIPGNTERVIIPSIKDHLNDNRKKRVRCLQDSLLSYHIDLMVYHAWYDDALIMDLLTCKLNHTKFLIHCHGVFSHVEIFSPHLFSNLPYAYALADGIVALNDIDISYWSQFNDNVFQVINPMDLDNEYLNEKRNTTEKKIIWCQRFSPEKRPEDAIDVFNIVHKSCPNTVLMLVGDVDNSSYSQQIKKHIDKLNLADSIHILGYHKEVKELYNQADICLITSDYEGFSMGLAESMNAGVPVVMYSLPYLTLVQKGHGIISVNNHDIDEMAQQVIKLINDDNKRKQLGKEARESIGEIMSFDFRNKWKNVFSRLEEKDYHRREIPLLWDTLLTHNKMSDNAKNAYELSEIRKSFSYRLGHALTRVPRWIRHKLTGFPM